MELTRQEINRNRTISAITSLSIFLLLLLFLILYKIITPNPPFPETGGGGGQELALGMMDLGNDDIDFGSMGEVTDVVAEETPVKENVVTAVGGEDVKVEDSKPEIKNNKTVITPVKPKEVVPEKTAAEKLREKFLKNTGKNGGGKGDNEEAGQDGRPDGNPNTDGNGGTGTGEDGGNGPGKGPGSGPGFGGGKYGFALGNRTLVQPPKLPSDTKEEGKVVVEITVDSQGNVIEANPNGRGTTTSSALLKAKARQAALATKFNVDSKFEEQRGTITIIFSF
jgi:TonB family protein